MKEFQGFIVRKSTENTNEITTQIETLPFSFLKEYDVVIKTHYSSINYKDFLATKPRTGVIFDYPLIPGIDVAGEVVESHCPEYQKGDLVFATSYDLGTKENGGFSQYVSLKKEWIIPLPQQLTLKEAMTYGTAGYTAALAILNMLSRHPAKDAQIAITGATGGVGSFSALLLNKLGYPHVTLITQKENHPYLTQLPHENVLSTKNLLDMKKKALSKRMYDVVIDTVGGELLSQLLPQIKYNGIVLAIGNAGGINLETTVLPFILRNICLQGVDSVATPYEKRKEVWDFLSTEGKIDFNSLNITEIPFENIQEGFDIFAKKEQLGRILITF